MMLSALLVVILVVASVIDVRSQRIPNWLTYPAILFGIGYHTLSRGLDGLLFSGAGMLLGFGLLVLFYLLGGLGAGDVKLMAAVGAFLGPKGVITAFILTALVGGVYALFLLFKSRRFASSPIGLGTPLAACLASLACQPSSQTRGGTAPKLCYGVAIGVGTLLSIVLKGYLY